jgi:hypothetical protein
VCVLVQGVRLELNGATVLEEPLLVHGNDGSAQYHVAMPGLTPGVFELRASLQLTRAYRWSAYHRSAFRWSRYSHAPHAMSMHARMMRDA